MSVDTMGSNQCDVTNKISVITRAMANFNKFGTTLNNLPTVCV